MSRAFLGLDGEMTGGGRDPNKRPGWHFFQLVQIGAAYRDDMGDYSLFSSDIGYDEWDEEPKAMAVHGMTRERILAAPRAQVVDAQLRQWFEQQGIQKAIPIGYGVAAFDMPYVRRYLPEASQFLSMQSLDLTGVALTLSEVTGRSFKAIKRDSKQYAERQILQVLKKQPEWHDAGYDAMAALMAWEFFKQIIVVREIHYRL